MADLTFVAPIRLAEPHGISRISGYAGEALTAGDCCYVKDDGMIWKSVSVIATGDQFDGYCLNDCVAGDAVTIFGMGHKIRIGAHGLDIGAFLYVSDTAGLSSDASIPTPVLDYPIAKAISATVIEVTRCDRPPSLNP